MALVANPFVLLLEPGFDLGRAEQIWHTVSTQGSSFEDILSDLVKQGMADLPSFALLEMLNDGTGTAVIAVRGGGVVETATGSITGEEATTWVEAHVQADNGLRVKVLGEEEKLSGRTASDHAVLPLLGGMVSAQNVTVGTIREEVSEPVEHTQLSIRKSKQSEVPEQVTLLSKRSQTWVLQFNTGQNLTVSGRVVVGRRPVLLPGDPDGTVVEALLSPQREISGRHAILTATPEGVLVQDANSTNGSIVRPAGGAPILLKDGTEFLLNEKDEIDFGDGNIAVCARQ